MNICFVCLLWTSICGCGSGESGCSACGCCKACARELDGQEARQRGIFDAVKEMIPLDLLLGMLNDIFQHIKAQILIVLAQWQMQGASQRTAHAILVHVSVKVQREWAMKYSSKDLKKKDSLCATHLVVLKLLCQSQWEIEKRHFQEVLESSAWFTPAFGRATVARSIVKLQDITFPA